MIRELVNVLVTLADATGAVFLLAWGGGEKRRKRGGNGRCGMRRTQGEKQRGGKEGKKEVENESEEMFIRAILRELYWDLH